MELAFTSGDDELTTRTLFPARWVEENGRVWYNMRPIDMSNKRLLLGRENAMMRYSAAYPTGAERCRF